MDKSGKKSKSGKRRSTKRLSIKKELVSAEEHGTGKLGAAQKSKMAGKRRPHDRHKEK
jgi:hypothetical protein